MLREHAPRVDHEKEQPMLPIDTLYRGRQINPDGIALEDDTTQLTYRELVARVEALAAALQERLPTP